MCKNTWINFFCWYTFLCELLIVAWKSVGVFTMNNITKYTKKETIIKIIIEVCNSDRVFIGIKVNHVLFGPS